MAASDRRRVRESQVSPAVFAVVQVPRAMFTEGLWSQPFDDLYKLAEKEWRGLSTTTTTFRVLPAAPPDTAWLRRGPEGQVTVYQQNWGDDRGSGIDVFARAQ